MSNLFKWIKDEKEDTKGIRQKASVYAKATTDKKGRSEKFNADS